MHSGPGRGRALQDLELARVVRRTLSEGGIDLVHAHNVEGPLLAALGARRRGVPVVWTPHTRMADELPTFFRRGRRALRLVGAGFDRLARAASDAVVLLSPEHDLAGSLPSIVLPPGIDPGDLAGADPVRGRALAGDGPFVAYAGNTDAYQDLPDLFAAMDHLPGVRLVAVVPDGGGLPQAAHMRVVVSRRFADTRDVLAAAAVAVVPRRLCAGFPMKLLNQVALGVPTVVTSGAAAPIDGLTVVGPGDPEGMARAIAALLADPESARARADRARDEVLRTWTWEARGGELEAFYARLLG